MKRIDKTIVFHIRRECSKVNKFVSQDIYYEILSVLNYGISDVVSNEVFLNIRDEIH